MATKKNKTQDPIENEIPMDEDKVEAQTFEENENKVEAVDIDQTPDRIKPILKAFSNLEEAYIDPKGGVYSKDTDPSLLGCAVLYKNPYYKH